MGAMKELMLDAVERPAELVEDVCRAAVGNLDALPVARGRLLAVVGESLAGSVDALVSTYRMYEAESGAWWDGRHAGTADVQVPDAVVTSRAAFMDVWRVLAGAVLDATGAVAS